MTSLKKLFDRAWAASEARSWVKGLLGKPDGAGGYTVAITDRPGFVYVRVAQGGGESVTIAKNLGRVANRANLPVKMRLEAGGTYTIFEVDSTTYSAATPDDESNEFGVAYHTHRIDSGLTYELEALRIEMGRVYPAGGWTVYVNAFRYFYNGAWQTFEGETIDLSTNQPSTTGKHRLVVVGVDPDTNLATAVNGSDVDTTTALTLADVDAISVGTLIPCGAVIMREDDTSVEDYTTYFDVKNWFGPSLTFSDSEGNPADVTTSTPADGTSVYAARRDHAHGLANSAVTNAKLANMAEGTIKGRMLGEGTGAPQDILLVDGPQISWVWASPADELTLALTSGSIGTTSLANDAVTDAKLRNSGALSVIGRSANSTGDPADISATATSDAVLRESGSTLGFGTVATGGIAADAVANAKLANMAESTIKGRAAGAGTGDPADLTAAQVRALLGLTAGGTLAVNTTQTGNVGTGEDTLASYTVPANQLGANGDTLWFEAFGTLAANSNSKALRVRFGSGGVNLIYEQTSTSWGTHWSVRGRLYRTGASTQKASVDLICDNDDLVTTQTTTNVNQDLTATVVLSVTAEAVADNDVVIEGLIVGWQPAP
ncbi:MAG: hypothetical protein E6Q97_03350 [Desulfurellales bacterium]|nr:MAG: hypothetical protein E6Q97_03350 [Desulfurellales bacterium]